MADGFAPTTRIGVMYSPVTPIFRGAASPNCTRGVVVTAAMATRNYAKAQFIYNKLFGERHWLTARARLRARLVADQTVEGPSILQEADLPQPATPAAGKKGKGGAGDKGEEKEKKAHKGSEWDAEEGHNVTNMNVPELPDISEVIDVCMDIHRACQGSFNEDVAECLDELGVSGATRTRLDRNVSIERNSGGRARTNITTATGNPANPSGAPDYNPSAAAKYHLRALRILLEMCGTTGKVPLVLARYATGHE